MPQTAAEIGGSLGDTNTAKARLESLKLLLANALVEHLFFRHDARPVRCQLNTARALDSLKDLTKACASCLHGSSKCDAVAAAK
jgi:hypothetical protein